MAKLRFVDGVPEVDGDPKELAEFLQSYNISTNALTSNKAPMTKELTNKESNPISIPTADQIVAIIEGGGRPFSFSMAEQQILSYGEVLSSKTDRQNYERYYGEFRKAMKIMLKKYGGRWDSANVKVKGAEGSHYSRYTLIEEDTKQPQSIETNEVVQTLIDQPKIQPQEEEVDLFKM